MKTIILAGGCFWGVEAYFSHLKGVVSTTVGYTDGPSEHPTYQDVCHHSGHAEACRIEYDELRLPLTKVLDHFFRIVDPTEVDRQGNDVGTQYRNALYYLDEADREILVSRVEDEARKYRRPIVTAIKPAAPFYEAERYHQDYLDKNPGGYCHVNLGLLKPEERK